MTQRKCCPHGTVWFRYLIFFAVILGWRITCGVETQRVYLSGKGRLDAIPWKFQCTSGNKSGEWSELPVPSHWDMQGFGSLHYRKDPPTAVDEKGLYEHEFRLSPDWKSRRIFLVFEGVMTDAAIKVNGIRMEPIHQGAFYRFKYEITGVVQWDKANLLEVEVAKHSTNTSVNVAERQGDYWLFGGIFRPVYLEAVPRRFVERIAIDADANGELAIDVFLDQAGETSPLTLSAQVYTLAGGAVGDRFSCPVAGKRGHLRTAIHHPKTWNAETPHLYSIEVSLRDAHQTVHQMQQRFGFRTLEVREGDGFYLNGQRIILKGVNRHSCRPESGRCLSDEDHRLDIETIKAMNMNAVRMSHYPPDQAFLDLCDELGLYVLDELAGWHWHYDTPTGKKLVTEMVTRDVNHPCILFWNNGNEGGFNKELDQLFTDLDPQQRPVLHAWEAFEGINTAHYLVYPRAKVASEGAPTRHGTGEKYEEWEDPDDPQKYIYMPTEMLHGLYDGGGGAGLEDYWTLMQRSPLLGGAFLWVFADEGVINPATGQLDCAGNQAPDGIVGPYREREASFFTIQELWSPISLRRLSSRQVSITNHYAFTNASECSYEWELLNFAGPHEPTDDIVLHTQTGVLPFIAPGRTGKIELSSSGLPDNFDAMRMRVSDPGGRELWTWVWPSDELGLTDEYEIETSGVSPEVVETAEALRVRSGDLEIQFNRKSGLLARVVQDGRLISLANGPRVPNELPVAQRLDWNVTNGVVAVSAEYDGRLRSLDWQVRPNGWVTCRYVYREVGAVEYHGVVFDYPADRVEGKRWLGHGPFRVWKNRQRGVKLGMWKTEFNDTVTGYSGWTYPEFKGCFSHVVWMRLDTTEGEFLIVPGSRDTYLQVLTPDAPPENLVAKTKVSLPKAGVGILHGIPPMGSKFKHASTTGPQGQLNEAAGEHAGEVSFYFGSKP